MAAATEEAVKPQRITTEECESGRCGACPRAWEERDDLTLPPVLFKCDHACHAPPRDKALEIIKKAREVAL